MIQVVDFDTILCTSKWLSRSS